MTSSASSDLKSLLAKSRRHNQIARQVQALLPTELAHHCTLGRLDGDRLVMIAASGAWATRLKYAADMLIHQCNQHFGTKVCQLSIKIDEALFRDSAKSIEPTAGAELSPTARRLVKQALEDGNNEVLRPFLEGLSRIAVTSDKPD